MKKPAQFVSCGLAVLATLLIWGAPVGEPGSQLVVMTADEAILEARMEPLRGFFTGPGELLVDVPGGDPAALSAGGVHVLGSRGDAPLWNSPYPVPDEILGAAGVDLVYRTERITVFSGEVDRAYMVLDSGYSISRVKFTPVNALLGRPAGEELHEKLLAERPMTRPRAHFIRSITEGASPDSVEKTIYFMNFDGSSGRYRSRFCARYDLKQNITPYIRQRLEQYVLPAGGAVWEQEFEPELPEYYKGQDTVFVNIVADLPGTRTSARYIICGHYDAIGVRQPGWDWRTDAAPGADDNASGATTVLECARLLAGQKFDFGITFALWSAEEIGLLGSDYYAENLAANDTIIGVINIDMVGYTEAEKWIEIVYGYRDGWITEALQETADNLGLQTQFIDRFRPEIHNSDHAPFWWQGIPALMIGAQTLGYLPEPLTPHYHTLGDTLGNVDFDQVADNVRLVAAYMLRFADIPGDSLSDLVVTPASIEFGWEGRSSGYPLVAGSDLTATVRALNVGGPLSGPAVYTFTVRQGRDGTGPVVHEGPVGLEAVAGGIAEAAATWKTSLSDYGDIDYSISLVPVDEDVESDVGNNQATVTLTVSPVTARLENLHFYPNPVESPNDAVITADIFTSQTNFLASYLIEVFDVTGLRVLRGEGLIDAPEFKLPLASLSGNAGHLAPGLYVCVLKMNVRDETADLSAHTKFAVVSRGR